MWDLPGLLRRGPVSAPLEIAGQPWTMVVTSVGKVASTRDEEVGSIYVVRLRLFGPYNRRRTATLLIDESQIDCPDLPTEMLHALTAWLPHSCGSGSLTFRPGCQHHASCGTVHAHDRFIGHLLRTSGDG